MQRAYRQLPRVRTCSGRLRGATARTLASIHNVLAQVAALLAAATSLFQNAHCHSISVGRDSVLRAHIPGICAPNLFQLCALRFFDTAFRCVLGAHRAHAQNPIRHSPCERPESPTTPRVRTAAMPTAFPTSPLRRKHLRRRYRVRH